MPWLGAADLARAVERAPNLRELRLRGCAVPDVLLEILPRLSPDLEVLDVSQPPEGAELLTVPAAKFPKLKTLALAGRRSAGSGACACRARRSARAGTRRCRSSGAWSS